MGTVLLAVKGAKPDAPALQYALDLCSRIKADLKVLQIIQTKEVGSFLHRFRNTANKARYFFEGSMAAAAFAEQGEFDGAIQLMKEAEQNMYSLLQQKKESGIQPELAVTAGNSEEVIADYVQSDLDIQVVVYDSDINMNSVGKLKSRFKKEVLALTKKLPIPVVVVPEPGKK